ncbi:MAG: hypothetical protein K2P94_10080 [Rhodospirillaceae bacterium]|nr:hypothetical protein [Rhodospirillaceae bacterium]
MKRKLRYANLFFWVAAWAAINTLMRTWSDPVLVVLQAVAPLMVGLFVHIALRDQPPAET